MKKDSVLKRLAQLKAQSENQSGEELEMMPYLLMELLLEYINDEQIRVAVDEINF